MHPWVSETIQNILGLDDEAVERTDIIDREGYRVRRRLKEIAEGLRNPDPAYTGFLRLMLAYAHGNPGKLRIESKQRESLVFVTTNGLAPWDPRADLMKAKTDRMLAAGADEEKVLALEAKGEKVPVPVEAKDATDTTDRDTAAPEGLELVQEPPEDFGARRR